MLKHPLSVRIRKKMVEAISRFQLLEAHDRVLVAVSGGKDSAILLALLGEIQRRSPFPFELQPLILDQKQPGFILRDFKAWVGTMGFDLTVLEEDTYSIVKEKVQEGRTHCSVCSRLRRGILYSYAHANGFTKIALGHHANDLMETLLMNIFFSGKIAAMPARLQSLDGRNTVIRPLCLTFEEELKELSEIWSIPTIPCNLCGSQENLQRKKMKALLKQLRASAPDIQNSMLSALGNVDACHLLTEIAPLAWPRTTHAHPQ